MITSIWIIYDKDQIVAFQVELVSTTRRKVNLSREDAFALAEFVDHFRLPRQAADIGEHDTTAEA